MELQTNLQITSYFVRIGEFRSARRLSKRLNSLMSRCLLCQENS